MFIFGTKQYARILFSYAREQHQMIIHWFMGIYTIINKSNVEIYVEYSIRLLYIIFNYGL